MKTSQLALTLIKEFESLHDGDLKKVGLQPKMDPIGIWTVGYGHALRDSYSGNFLKGDKDKVKAYNAFPNLTPSQASILLMDDLRAIYEPAALKMITRKDLTDDQFGALVSFCYNCGTHYENAQGKKLPYAIWANVNNCMPDEQLRQYWATSVIKAGGKVLPGLVRRRKAESILFTRGLLNLNP